ncbi:PIN domain-containing protein [Paenibacillus sp. LHD-117]|uniref:PIN domain-containing protein n=1 Tax=Paenibacillus sp. LHD-117 TaxID=3071412 RepID=UPI0027DFF975|nr:PIN domain-containing protein [Paenibacillus sp. LHD-117]MDQ6419345.1 PIN domain-containing protein [Paenibacillus sp. LHD-117]
MVKKGVILDTNIAIGLLNDNRTIVQTILNLQKSGYDFYFSVITKCELLSGVKNDIEWKAVQNIGVNRFIDVNNDIATIAGNLRMEQRKESNRNVKAPDSLIVATAVHKKYDIYTLDKGMRFAEQYGINIINSIEI